VADAVEVDEIVVDILPSLRRFLAELRKGTAPAAATVGREVGRQIGEEIEKAVSEAILNGLRKAKARAAGAKMSISVDADTGEAEAKVERLKRKGGKIRIEADVEVAAAEARVATFRGRASADGIRIDVDADTGGAEAKIAALKASGDKITIRTNVAGGNDRGDGRDSSGRFVGNAAGAGGGGAGGGLSQIASQAANAASGMQGLIIVGLALAPALVPAAAAVAGALVALAGAAVVAGVAVGTIGLAFSGIGDAYSALSNNAKKAGSSAGAAADKTSQIAGALERVQSAERALANAQADAADAAIRNAEREVDAQRKVKDATDELTRAQKELVDAREDARRELEDLNLDLAANGTAQKRAALDLRKAKDELLKVNTDESKTADERLAAQLAVEEAEQGIERQRVAGERLASAKADADKNGIEGSKQVVDATRGVEDAQQGVTDALRDQQDTAREIAASQRQTATSLIEANLSLVQAQRSYTDALKDTGGAGAASMNQVNQAMKDLSPAGQEFVHFLYDTMRPAFDSLKFTAQETVLPGIQAALTSLLPIMPQINGLVAAFGTEIGAAAQKIAGLFTSPEGLAFIAYLTTEGPKILGYLVDIGLAFGKIFIVLITAFGPVIDQVIGGIADFATQFAALTEQFVKSPEFQQFLQYIMDNGPTLATLFLSLVVIIIKLAIAFAPFGQMLLEGITAIFAYIASLDPNTILLIFVLLAALVVALAIAFGGPVIAIAAVVLAVAGLFALIINVAPAIGRFFQSMWNDYIWPALHSLWVFLDETIPNAVNNFLAWVGNGLISAGKSVLGFISGLLTWIGDLPYMLARAGSGLWDWIWKGIKSALNLAIDFWNDLHFDFPRVSIGSVTLIPAFRIDTPNLGHFAAGGVIPGYTPGRDTTLIAVGGGEAVMRPEWTRAVESAQPGYISAANHAARSGGVSGVQKFTAAMAAPRFAVGGIVNPNGLAFATSARADDQTEPVGSSRFADDRLPGGVTVNLFNAKSNSRSDAKAVGDELSWQARLGTGRG
jgi:hypothetical protein